MMKRVTKWMTDDGKLFDDESLARQHENMESTFLKLMTLLAVSTRTGRPESVLREILVESSKVSDILAAYRRKLPAKKNVVKKSPKASIAA